MGDAGSVHAAVAEWVDRTPDSVAVRDAATAECLTYRGLWDRAGDLAAALVAAGIRPRDPVPVAIGRSVELAVAFLGVLRARAGYLPLDAMAPEKRIQGILDEVGTDFVLTRALDAEVWPNLPARVRPVPVPAASGTGDVPLDQVDVTDPAYICYTSGSTGAPKGVVVPHRAVLRLVRGPVFCDIGPGDRVANGCNPAFDVTTFEMWNTLTAGATLVILPSVATDLSIDAWAELARAEGIDTMFLTTSLFHTVARERPDAFGALREMLVAGEQLEIGAARAVLAAGPPGRLVNAYGPTEATTFASYFDCTPATLDGLDRVPIGYPIQETTLRILDDDLRPVPAGAAGELCIGGAGLATGYLGRPEQTAARFVTDPGTGERLYRSGDVCRELPGGAIEYLGRADRQVKLRGFRVELPEIERVATATGLVDAAFVEKTGDGAAAVLVGFALPANSARHARTGLPVRLTAALSDRLPPYMVPSRWVLVDRLPIGPTGKADRAALLRLLDEDDTGAVPGESSVVGDLASIWAEVLGVDGVTGEDNFLDLGGTSVAAMQVVSRIDQRFGVTVEPGTVLLADTLGELAAHVGELESVVS